jgi:hypothetical protein
MCARLKQREPKAQDIAELCKDVPVVAVPDSAASRPPAAGGGLTASRR